MSSRPDHALPRWPADCFDSRPLPKLESITVPPGSRKFMVCEGWPECGCMGDCELPPIRVDAPARMLAFVLIVIGIAGLGLLYLALR